MALGIGFFRLWVKETSFLHDHSSVGDVIPRHGLPADQLNLTCSRERNGPLSVPMTRNMKWSSIMVTHRPGTLLKSKPALIFPHTLNHMHEGLISDEKPPESESLCEEHRDIHRVFPFLNMKNRWCIQARHAALKIHWGAPFLQNEVTWPWTKHVLCAQFHHL